MRPQRNGGVTCASDPEQLITKAPKVTPYRSFIPIVLGCFSLEELYTATNSRPKQASAVRKIRYLLRSMRQDGKEYERRVTME